MNRGYLNTVVAVSLALLFSLFMTMDADAARGGGQGRSGGGGRCPASSREAVRDSTGAALRAVADSRPKGSPVAPREGDRPRISPDQVVQVGGIGSVLVAETDPAGLIGPEDQTRLTAPIGPIDLGGPTARNIPGVPAGATGETTAIITIAITIMAVATGAMMGMTGTGRGGTSQRVRLPLPQPTPLGRSFRLQPTRPFPVLLRL